MSIIAHVVIFDFFTSKIGQNWQFWAKNPKTRFLDRFFIFAQIHHFWPKSPILADFRGEKIENHDMGDYRHIDMFSRTECHPEINSARSKILKGH